jgi:hypothetical protein
MSRMFSSGLRLALVAAVALTLASVTAAASMTAASAAKVRSLEVQSLTIDQDRVVGGNTFTGTVTLNQVAPNDVEVALFVNADRPEYATLTQDRVIVQAGSTSTTFTGTTTTPAETDLVSIQALLADGTSTVTPSDQFFLVATPQTDLITITRATMSKSGKLTVVAVSDDPTAVLTAEFAGQNVPGDSVDGKFRGELQFSGPTAGEVVVRSDLGGCARRNPLGSSGTLTCRG